MLKKYGLAASAAIAMAAFASPASAAVTACSTALNNLTTPDAQSCVFDSGNLNGGSSTKVAQQQAAISALPGSFEWDGVWSNINKLGSEIGGGGLTDGNHLDFGTMLYGLTVISAHFGNVSATPGGNVTVFWQFDFGTQGASYVSIDNTQGWSNAVLYTTGGAPPPPAVPEPTTWLLMILGFGAIGYGMRRKNNALADIKIA